MNIQSKRLFSIFAVFMAVVFAIDFSATAGVENSYLAPQSPFLAAGNAFLARYEIDLHGTILEDLRSIEEFSAMDISIFSTKELYILQRIVRFLPKNDRAVLDNIMTFFSKRFFMENREDVLKAIENIVNCSLREVTDNVREFLKYLEEDDFQGIFLDKGNYWHDKQGDCIEVLTNLIVSNSGSSENGRTAFRQLIVFLKNVEINLALSKDSSPWCGKGEIIAKILKNISHRSEQRASEAIHELFLFLTSPIIMSSLREKGSPLKGKADEVLNILVNISNKARERCFSAIKEFRLFLEDEDFEKDSFGREILSTISRISAGRRIRTAAGIKEFAAFLKNTGMRTSLSQQDSPWRGKEDKMFEIFSEIIINAEYYAEDSAKTLISILNNSALREALKNEGSFWYGKQDKILEILLNIFTEEEVWSQYLISEIGHYLSNPDIFGVLSREDSLWRGKEDSIMEILVALSKKKKRADAKKTIEACLSCLNDNSLRSVLVREKSPWLEKEDKDKVLRIIANIVANAGGNASEAINVLKMFLVDNVNYARDALRNSALWRGKKEVILEILLNIASNAGENTASALMSFYNFLTDINSVMTKSLKEGGLWHEEEDTIVETLLSISINAGEISSRAINALNLLLRNRHYGMPEVLKNDGFWRNHKRKIFEIMNVMLSNNNREINDSIDIFLSFLASPNTRVLFEKSSPWHGKEKEILEVLAKIFNARQAIPKVAVDEYLLFLNSDVVKAALNDAGSPMYEREDVILEISANILVHPGVYTDTAFRELKGVMANPYACNARGRKELIDDLISRCLSAENRNVLLSAIYARRNSIMEAEAMEPFFTLAMLAQIFPENDILDRIISRVMLQDGQIDLLIHPFSVAFSIVSDRPVSLSLDLPNDLRAGQYPKLSYTRIRELPVIKTLDEIGFPEDSKFVTAGRNIQTQDINGERWNLKLLRSGESMTDLNFEAWAYEQIRNTPDSGYTGIIPEALRPEGVTGDVYLVKIPKSLVSPDRSQKLFVASDDCYVGFAYKAKSGYFDYVEGKVSPREMIAWYKNLAVLGKKYGLFHRELISIFHNIATDRRYSLDNVPSGRLDDVVSAVRYANVRAEETVGDLGRDHMGNNLYSSIREQLFEITLVVADRMHRQGISVEEFAILLKEGLESYCSVIFEDDPVGMSYTRVNILNKINYFYYAMHTLYGFENKQDQGRGLGKIDLGYFNCALSIHGLVDLVDLVSLGIVSGITKTSQPFKLLRSEATRHACGTAL